MYMLARLWVVLGLVCASTLVMAESIDINTATVDQFDQVMVGVGKSKAEAIVKDRETNGPFKTVDDLTRVKGIGAATIQQNRDKLTTSPSQPASPASNPNPTPNKTR